MITCVLIIGSLYRHLRFEWPVLGCNIAWYGLCPVGICTISTGAETGTLKSGGSLCTCVNRL